MRRHILETALAVSLVAAVGACLPTLEDACTSDDGCAADRMCVGGVCAPRQPGDGALDNGLIPADGSPDGAADATRPDGNIPLPDEGPPPDDAAPPADDQGPVSDAGSLADADSPGDGDCTVEPAMCNQLDDNCNGLIDEQAEAVEGCPGAPRALASCGLDGCQYVCEDGAIPLGAGPADGCRTLRGCTLAGQWVEIASGFEKRDDDRQQIVIAAAGDQRFIAVHDLAGERREAVVRSFVFAVDAPDVVSEARLGQAQEALAGTLTDMTAVAVGERFVVGARIDAGGEVAEPVQLMALDPGVARLRTLRTRWAQSPALVVVDAEEPTLVTLVESHVNRADPPMGGTVADLWPEGAGGGAVEPRQAAPERPTGPMRDAAFVLSDGAVGMVGDVVGADDGAGSRYGLRVDRFTAEFGVDRTWGVALDGPVVGPISVARGNAGFVVFTAVQADGGVLQWRILRVDGSDFVGEPISVPWPGPPVAPRALALPGGPGVIFRESDDVRIALPDPGFDDFAFEGILPGTDNKVRAVAAVQPDRRTVEVALLREDGGEGVVEYGRYVCH